MTARLLLIAALVLAAPEHGTMVAIFGGLLLAALLATPLVAEPPPERHRCAP